MSDENELNSIDPGRSDSEMLDLRRLWLRRDTGAPAKDCWLLIPPSGVHLTPEIEKAWLERARDLRRLRGEFLVAGFEIEYCVDQILAAVLFVPPQGDETGNKTPKVASYMDLAREAFDKLFLKSSENQFGRKIGLLKKLTETFPALGDRMSKPVFERLRKIMDVRNVFAHYPIVLVLDPRAGNSQVHALLIRGEEPIELSRSYLEQQFTLFSMVDAELSKIREEFTKDPLKTAPGGLGKVIPGRVFLGHADLNVGKWFGIDRVGPDTQS
jgi:hypothetical protein